MTYTIEIIAKMFVLPGLDKAQADAVYKGILNGTKNPLMINAGDIAELIGPNWKVVRDVNATKVWNCSRFFTREDHLEDLCTHREYYAQFADARVKNRVLQAWGMDELLNAKLSDLQGNLKKWDNTLVPFPSHIGDAMRERGDVPTLSGSVCIAKEAARQIIEEWED